MQELAKWLRGEACGGSNWNEKINKAADLIESQAAEIAELKGQCISMAMELTGVPRYKYLCDRMGGALEEVTALALCGKKDHLPGRCDQITKIAYKTLEAWGALK